MLIVLPFHIIVALSGLFYSFYAFFKPSQKALSIIYALLALTIVSGSYLIVISHTHMLQTCFEGLLYVGIMVAGIFAVKNKLAHQI